MFTDKKLKEYNDREERFKQAIEEAQTNKTASINSIANKYRVSRTTLSRRIHGFKNTRTSHEKQQKFTNEEELIIIDKINTLLKTSSQIPPKKEILVICEDLLKTKYVNTPPSENESFFKVGKNWIDRFLERHNDKLMINDKTSLCEYYKYEFLQRKKLRSNRDYKTEEDSSPSLEQEELNHHKQALYHQQQLQHNQTSSRPLNPPVSGDYIYPNNVNSNMDSVVMNIPNGFVVPTMMPQTFFNNEMSSWNPVNSVPMKHSNKAPYAQSNQSMNFQFPTPSQQSQIPQQPQQQSSSTSLTPSQQHQPALNRNVSNLSGYGTSSILNNHGVHLNGNAVVNIYPDGAPIPPNQTGTPTTSGLNPYLPQNNYQGLNNYALHAQQQLPSATQQQQQQLPQPQATASQQQQHTPHQTEPKVKLSPPSSIDMMEYFNNQRFLYENARIKLTEELTKTTPDLVFATKLVNLSFDQFEKELQTNTANTAVGNVGEYMPSYR